MDYSKLEAKAAAREQFRGVWAAITTPFTLDLNIDEAGLRQNMRHLTDKLHVDGVFCTGAMGEFWSLTSQERKRIVEIVVEEARGKCRVIAHTGHHAADETVDLTNHAQKAGADYVILMTPYYPFASEEMVYDWFSYVAQRTQIGIWLFDTVFSDRPAMSPELFVRLAEQPNICGAKISRTIEHYVAVQKAVDGALVLSSPAESQFLMMIREHGQRVHQSSASPFLLQTATSQRVRQYAELALDGRLDEAAQVSATLDPLRKVQHKWIMGDYHETGILPIAAIKAWSEMLGMAGGPVRTPLLQMNEERRTAMRAEIESSDLLDS
ncbi:dihydrodipicolinate synthase family protein [Paraburkholderia nemoris]|uniref:dihydrodipicolinate synthase family protein n=1 Tax=Paraburkholderia nemoris TaxID=2793076 RepID=UPI0038BB7A45